MKITVNDGEYLNYSQYAHLKELFGRDRTKMPSFVTLGEIFDKTQIKEKDKTTYHSAFSELLRHINNSGVFFRYDKEACWYISYILQREVDEFDKREYTSHVHDLLKEFILKFNRNRSETSNICMKDYVHINPDTYKIMNELYILYDEYTKYKPIYDNTIPRNCENFSNFIRLYNGFINNYVSGTDSFNKILNHFDTEIRKTISKYNIIECRNYPYKVSKLNLYTPPEPEKTIAPVPAEQLQTQNMLARTGLQNTHHDVAHPSVTPLGEVHREEAEHEKQVAEVQRETAHGQEITRNNVISPEPGRVFKSGEAHNPEISRAHGMTHGNRRTYNHGGEEAIWRTGLSTYSQDTATMDSSSQLGLSNVSSISQKLDTKAEDDGIFANVRSTFSSIAEHVEPAPILGVSGGMGVLFLLFKYTPVGSFFGGRRGRNLRIPSGFPGAYPGFPEYYDDNDNLF